MKKTALILVLPAVLVGCASTTVESQGYKSYVVGQTKTATIGDPFLVDQNGTISSVKHWVGIINSPDGWEVTKVASQDFVKKELIYSGKSATTIEVSYREFRGGFAAPAFSQNLKYDLNESKTIRFQRFVIEVISATNQTITYQIVGD